MDEEYQNCQFLEPNFDFPNWGGSQNLEGENVERPIFRNFKITNIKITKDELFKIGLFLNLFFHYS